MLTRRYALYTFVGLDQHIVTLRHIRLVPGLVTIFEQVNYLGAQPESRSTHPEPSLRG